MLIIIPKVMTEKIINRRGKKRGSKWDIKNSTKYKKNQ